MIKPPKSSHNSHFRGEGVSLKENVAKHIRAAHQRLKYPSRHCGKQITLKEDVANVHEFSLKEERRVC